MVKPAEYTDRLLDSSSPPNAAIRYGTAIHGRQHVADRHDRVSRRGELVVAHRQQPAEGDQQHQRNARADSAEATSRPALTLRG